MRSRVNRRRYGFNPASVGLIDSAVYARVAGRAAVTTTLAGGAGGVSALVYGFARHRGWDLCGMCNGLLCGFVAVTACCHVGRRRARHTWSRACGAA
jgi:Amt family ammonium transporter